MAACGTRAFRSRAVATARAFWCALVVASALQPEATHAIESGHLLRTAMSPRSRRALERRGARRPRRRSALTTRGILGEVGFGPALVVPNPPLFGEAPLLGALALHLAGVAGGDVVSRHRDRAPRALRRYASSVQEVRARPWYLWLVPSTLVVSPPLGTAAAYGAVWRTLDVGLGVPCGPISAGGSLAIEFLYVYLASQRFGTTHLLRPALGLDLGLEFAATDFLRLRAGWRSSLFPPQELGGPPWQVVVTGDSLWHLGGPYAMLLVRFPLRTAVR